MSEGVRRSRRLAGNSAVPTTQPTGRTRQSKQNASKQTLADEYAKIGIVSDRRTPRKNAKAPKNTPVNIPVSIPVKSPVKSPVKFSLVPEYDDEPSPILMVDPPPKTVDPKPKTNTPKPEGDGKTLPKIVGPNMRGNTFLKAWKKIQKKGKVNDFNKYSKQQKENFDKYKANQKRKKQEIEKLIKKPWGKRTTYDEIHKDLRTLMENNRYNTKQWWTASRYGQQYKQFKHLHHRVSRPRALQEYRELKNLGESLDKPMNGLTKRLSRRAVQNGIYEKTRGGVPKSGLDVVKRTIRTKDGQLKTYKHLVSKEVQAQSVSKFHENRNIVAWKNAVKSVAEQLKTGEIKNENGEPMKFFLGNKKVVQMVRRRALELGYKPGKKNPWSLKGVISKRDSKAKDSTKMSMLDYMNKNNISSLSSLKPKMSIKKKMKRLRMPSANLFQSYLSRPERLRSGFPPPEKTS